MDTTTISLVGALVSTLTQLGVAVAAWRLASALRVTVANHEKRIIVLEARIP